jgi:hypothetical protein
MEYHMGDEKIEQNIENLPLLKKLVIFNFGLRLEKARRCDKNLEWSNTENRKGCAGLAAYRRFILFN